MKKSQIDLRNEPVGSLLWKMSLPSITAMLVMAFYNFVDVFWLSRLGPQECNCLCKPAAAITSGNDR